MQEECLQCFGLHTTAVIVFLEKRIQPHPLNHALFPSFLSVLDLLRVIHVAPKGKCQHNTPLGVLRHLFILLRVTSS